MIKDTVKDVAPKSKLEVKNTISRGVIAYIKKNQDKEDTRMLYYGLCCRMSDTFIVEALDAEPWGANFYKFNCNKDNELYYAMVSDLADFYRAVERYYTFKKAAKSTDETSYMNFERASLRDKNKDKARELYKKLQDKGDWDDEIIMPVFLPWIVM